MKSLKVACMATIGFAAMAGAPQAKADGEIIDTYDLLTHRRYVRTITETLREIGDHINRIYISGPRYGTVRCIERFLEALIAVTYLKGQSLMSITEISIL